MAIRGFTVGSPGREPQRWGGGHGGLEVDHCLILIKGASVANNDYCDCKMQDSIRSVGFT
jgi:hypothetical protein